MANKAKQTSAQSRKKRRGKTVAGIIMVPLIFAAVAAGVYFAGKSLWVNRPEKDNSSPTAENSSADSTEPIETTTTTETAPRFPYKAARTTETVTVDDVTKVLARNCVLIEVGENGSSTILAEHDADAEIYPASMTKMMSLVTFVNLVDPDELDAAIIMDGDVIAGEKAKTAHVTGFDANEACLVKDLLYAMMLPSGADAAVMLATYAAGSEEAFAEEMNKLAAEMGLEHSTFKNCTGLHEDGHVSSLNDLARILMTAMNDPFCREIMSTLEYTTASSVQHPEGIELYSTTLSRMVGDELEGLADPLHVIGGKTGYTNPAGQCLASWAESDAGKTYVCVVAGSSTFEPLDAVGDALTLYQLSSIPLRDIQRITVDEENLPFYEHY